MEWITENNALKLAGAWSCYTGFKKDVQGDGLGKKVARMQQQLDGIEKLDEANSALDDARYNLQENHISLSM